MKKTIIFSLFLLLALCVFISPPVQAAKCLAEKPDHAPDLFQIDVSKNSATLYFTPVNNAITNYTIAYGYARREDRFVVSFPSGRSDGVIVYAVNDLSPNIKYYFRVRADNGCRNGYWSDTMSVETNWERRTYTRVKGSGFSSNFPNKRAATTPTRGLVASPAAGFTIEVLGANENLGTGLSTDSGVLGTGSAEVREVQSSMVGVPWWKNSWLVLMIIALGTTGFFLWRGFFGY